MYKAFFCKACGEQLTAALTLRSGKDPSVPTPDFVDREPLTERGVVYRSYQPIARSFGGDPDALEFTPQFWVNPDDLTKAVRPTKRSERLNGCCGLSGASGPNQVCRCGAEIGTLKTDCWTPYLFIPEPSATSWAEVSAPLGDANS